MKFSQYTTKNSEEVLSLLQTNPNGLSEKEAKRRLSLYGPNEVKTKETGLGAIFLRQFKSPFFYLLFIAAAIAFLINEKMNGCLIFSFVVINLLLGFFQEARAQNATVLLKKYLSSKVRVLREGIEKKIEKSFLAPGDLILLEPGNIVPADVRLLKAKNFLLDESILSGESAAVLKSPYALAKEASEIFAAQNIVFSATTVISGEAEGVVVGTGKNTAVGEIAKLVSGISRESVYEKNVLEFSRLVLKIVLTTIVLVFLLNLIIKGGSNFFDFLIFSVALVVSIIPEALPLVVSFALSEGALKLAKEKVIVKRLSAVEDLGDIEILCTDKTGTLTENKLELAGIYSENKEKCLAFALFSSPFAKEEIGSSRGPFDEALFAAAKHPLRQVLKKVKVISEIPFDPFRLKNSVLVQTPEQERILICKGAQEVILGGALLPAGGEERLKKQIEQEGKKGRRVLAVAYKEFAGNDFSEKDEKDLIFLGFLSFFDPLKKSAPEAVNLARRLGLQIKIVTGDSKEVAGAVAKEIGLIDDVSKVILGETLDSYPEDDFIKACEDSLVFARVSPKTKFKIVEALRKKYVTAFLGEGINDAPALKAANVAIAVKEASDVSREVSDIILLKKDLKVIIDGIKTGRNIFSNINKYIKCTLSSNFGNFYSIALISLAIPFLPMLPVQILLVNLLSDFPLIAVASDKVDVEELKKPRVYRLNKFIPLIFLLALASTIFDFIFFGIFHQVAASLLQTLWFMESILTEIVLVFSVRTFGFFTKAKFPSLPLVFVSLLTFFITIFLPFTNFGRQTFHFTSPPLFYVAIVLFLIVGYFIVSEIVKLAYFRRWHRISWFSTR